MLAARAKTTRVLTVVGGLVCRTLRADPIEDLSRQPADAYKAGDFATAVARYRELVRLGPTRPELHLN